MSLAAAHAPGVVRGLNEDTLFRKIAWRILPVVFLCYIVAIIDRVNVGFAKLQMMSDLGLSASAYGLGAGIFFLAYCLFEIPSNLILHRVGARLWLARIMLTWGAITIATGFVQTSTQFYVARIALGIAEAGFYPGVVYYLSQWFPSQRRGRALATFVIAGPVGSMLVGPIAGWILATFEGGLGFHGWQWIFIVTGVPALIMAGVLYLMLLDRPDEANWLTSEEKREHAGTMQAEALLHETTRTGADSAIGNWRAWLAGVSMGTVYLGLYAIVFWTPSIIKASGVSDIRTVGWLSALPYLCAIVTTIALGRFADRTGRYRAVVLGSALIGAAGLLLSVNGGRALAATLSGVAIAAAFFTAALPSLWALVAGLFRSKRTAATGIALINTVASLGSFSGPYLTGLAQDMTGSITPALVFIAAAVSVGGLLAMILPRPARSTT